MQFNVSTLLHEPVGTTRTVEVEDEPVRVPDVGYAGIASGDVLLTRTPRGVLVRAMLDVAPTLECARCLTPFTRELRLDINEEYFPEHDPVTGARIEDAGPEDFRIDDLHHLDLSEAVRQYEATALPIQPICREDCAGLCPVCGQNLNERRCDCEPQEAVGPLAGLATLAEQLRAEETPDGRPQA